MLWYYLVPCRLSTDPEYMTLNGHFTLNFHYYEQSFQKLFYILTIKPIYRIFVVSRDQQRCAKADLDPQNISDPRKDC